MSDANQTLELLLKMGVIGQADVKAANDLLGETEKKVSAAAASAKDLGTSSKALADQYTDSLNPAVANATKKLEEEAEETVSLKEKKHALHAALHSLGPEYSALAQYSKFFFNPAVAGTVGLILATELYSKRIEEMTKALAGVELPDLDAHTKQLSVLEEVSRNYNTVLSRIAENYNSIESATRRAVTQENAQLELKKKEIEAAKQQALALLESQKSQLSPEEYARQKAVIEHSGAAATQGAGAISARRNLDQQDLQSHNLHADAANKKRAAEAITIASAEEDQKSQAERDKQTAAARKTIAESREWINRIAAAQDSLLQGIKTAPAFYLRYGLGMTGSDAMATEHQTINNAQGIIDSNDAAARRAPDRNALRQRRSDLTQQAAEEEGKARELESQVQINRRLQLANEQADKVIENTKFASQIVATLPDANARLLQIVEKLAAQNPEDLNRRLAALEARTQLH